MYGGPKLAGRKPNNINSILLNIKKISILFLVNNRKLFGIKLGLSWICLPWNTKNVHAWCVLFVQNTKCMNQFIDLKFDVHDILRKAYLVESRGWFPLGMILIGILTYFLLFFPNSMFDFKTSALNWSYVFHRARNVWNWSSVRHGMSRLF